MNRIAKLFIASILLSFSMFSMADSKPAKLFMPKIFGMEKSVWTPVFSKEGDQAFYVKKTPGAFSNYQIMQKTRIEGGWGGEKLAPFNSAYNDSDPVISPDGNTLIFCSDRPIIDGGKQLDNFDLWMVKKQGNSWGEAKHISEISDPTKWEIYPSISANGNLYFSADYDDNLGIEDIYVSAFKAGKYQKPVNLGNQINTEYLEVEAYIAPDESYIIFTSDSRPDSHGGNDLYISYRSTNNQWSKAVNLGAAINTEFSEQAPMVSNDGKTLLFSSKRTNSENNETYKHLFNGMSNAFEVKVDQLNNVKLINTN